MNNFPKLSSIIIGTSDLERAKKFYVAIFGITIEKESENYISALGVDGTHIEIEADTEYRFPNWKEHNIATYKNSEFTVSNIHKFSESVVKHGGKIVSQAKTRPWGTTAAEIADPDENIFLIVQK